MTHRIHFQGEIDRTLEGNRAKGEFQNDGNEPESSAGNDVVEKDQGTESVVLRGVQRSDDDAVEIYEVQLDGQIEERYPAGIIQGDAGMRESYLRFQEVRPVESLTRIEEELTRDLDPLRLNWVREVHSRMRW
jgi:hypothetical protein